MFTIILLYFKCSDGVVGDDAILEIKCPYIAKDTNDVTEAVNNKLVNTFFTYFFF